MARLNPLDHPVCFSSPLTVASSGWLHHVPFGMFLVDIVRPDLIVELGTYTGVSYCAFCQAVKELRTGARCYAVDTWEGDPQTSFYGPDVLEDLRKHHDPLYGSFSRLVQSTFDDALEHFDDGTIDLLHIDGYHAYEVVKHDFEAWLPKVSRRGVVLLHDINVREGDFGVSRLWNELKPSYPHFELAHGHGLGLVVVGASPPAGLSQLLDAAPEDVFHIREIFHQLGERVAVRWERDEATKGQRAIQDLIQRKNQAIEDLTAQASELTEVVRGKEQELQAAAAHITQLDAELAKKDQELKAHLDNREEALERLRAHLQEQDLALQAQASQISQKDGEIRRLSAQVEEQEELIAQFRNRLTESRAIDSYLAQIGERDQTVMALTTRVADLSTQLADKDRTIEEFSAGLAGWEAHWAGVQQTQAWRAAMALRRVAAGPRLVLRMLSDPPLVARRLSTYVPGRHVLVHIDDPVPDSTCSEVLRVRGWAFSSKGSVTRLEAFLDNLPPVPLNYGYPRPDVEEAFSLPALAPCGYLGILSTQGVQPGRHTLTVRCTDTGGTIGTQTRSLTVIRSATPLEMADNVPQSGNPQDPSPNPLPKEEPVATVERAVWSAGVLDVEGWAVWPATSAARRRWAHVSVDGRSVGEAPVNLSRPDIASGFPNNPAASRSGFRFVRPLALPSRGPQSLTVSINLIDETGIQTFRSVALVAGATQQVAVDESLRHHLQELFRDFESRMQREPAILDWGSGIDLSTLYPTYAVFSPIEDGGSSTLPYLDQTIDIVVLASGDGAALVDAKRVAAHVVAVVDPARRSAEQNGDRAEAVRVEWRSEQMADTSAPTVSIIIPVHDAVAATEACLERTVATLPSSFRGEIVVVDDASGDDTPAVLHGWAEKDRRIRVLRNSTNVGFVHSCNLGAEAATGEFLVFLNNDTLPGPNWLPPLLQIFRDRPDAGAVGGKLLYPDGTLQEAGCVIFSDGSGCNFGKHDPAPDAPLYTHVREVDYCSGALLATRRSLFEVLHGFDPQYAPAYYEDADYCFGLWSKGYRVYYQPESRVVHVEGASSGRELTSGVKRYQAVNQGKFVRKWAEALKLQPPPPSEITLVALYGWAVRDGAVGTPT